MRGCIYGHLYHVMRAATVISHALPNTANAQQLRIRKESAKVRKHRQAQSAIELKDQLPINMQRAMSLSTEKGSSNWLSTLPIAEHGFALHKSAF